MVLSCSCPTARPPRLSQECLRAFSQPLEEEHLISCMPGSEALTSKRGLIRTLIQAYGREDAGVLAPLAYTFPADYLEFARVVKTDPEALWVLKSEKHRGRGVRILPGREALKLVVSRSGEPEFGVAQRFIKDQILVDGRPMYIRMWFTLVGNNPPRAFLSKTGVAVFGSRMTEDPACQTADCPALNTSSGADMMVNLWRQDREAAEPWALQRTIEYLDAREAAARKELGLDVKEAREREEHEKNKKFYYRRNFEPFSKRFNARVAYALASAVAAALPTLRRASAQFPGFQKGQAFQVFGADFLIDADLKPWLLEINRLPSFARKSVGCRGQDCQSNAFDSEKEAFTRDLLGMLVGHYRVLQDAARLDRQREEEARAKGEEPQPPRYPRCLTSESLREMRFIWAETMAGVPQFDELMMPIFDALRCLGKEHDGSLSCARCFNQTQDEYLVNKDVRLHGVAKQVSKEWEQRRRNVRKAKEAALNNGIDVKLNHTFYPRKDEPYVTGKDRDCAALQAAYPPPSAWQRALAGLCRILPCPDWTCGEDRATRMLRATLEPISDYDQTPLDGAVESWVFGGPSLKGSNFMTSHCYAFDHLVRRQDFL